MFRKRGLEQTALEVVTLDQLFLSRNFFARSRRRSFSLSCVSGWPGFTARTLAGRHLIRPWYWRGGSSVICSARARSAISCARYEKDRLPIDNVTGPKMAREAEASFTSRRTLNLPSSPTKRKTPAKNDGGSFVVDGGPKVAGSSVW